jgi:small subunit ribosomal protein S14
MIREHKNIIKDLVKRKFFIKRELRGLILKTCFQNRYTDNSKRFFLKILMLSSKRKSSLSAQKKRCLLSGQSKSVYKNFEIGRHRIKQLNNIGMVQNLTIRKW